MAERLFLSPPHVTDLDRDALLRAFDSGWVAPAGPELGAFEDDLAAVVEVPAAVAVSSGTAALQLALELLEVDRGDHVVCQSFTFVATASAAVNAGCVPVFVDSEAHTWNLSPDLLAEQLAALRAGRKPIGAVIAVDLYGRCADYASIEAICDEYEVPLIEDAAEALGSHGSDRPAGGFGRFGVLSFNGNKILTTSGGGALLCHDTDVADRARYLVSQARQPTPHYEHTELGHNFRLSNLLAALGRSQLAQLPERVRRRREIRALYADAFADLDRIEVFRPDDPDDNAWLTCVVLDGVDREELRVALEAENIEARPVWKPMHLQPVFTDAERHVDGTSEDLFARSLCLPSGSSMTDGDVERVVEVVADFCSTH